jgi:hypothetical protein
MKKKIEYNFNKLKIRMKDKEYTQPKLGKVLGISRTQVNFRLNNRMDFRSSEISIIADILDIRNEIEEYFFTEKVKKI